MHVAKAISSIFYTTYRCADGLGPGMGRQASITRQVSVRSWMSVGTPGEVGRWVSRGRWASMGWWAWAGVLPTYEDGRALCREGWLGGWPANEDGWASGCGMRDG